MSDPLSNVGPHALDAASPVADADARIEQLLLGGLDHYFAARYEQAINVWTRVLFLDRAHPRARAYIERARGAIAERHRESEELVHNGVAALERGEGEEAHRLLSAAIDGGAAPDEAIVLLKRLERLGVGRSDAVEAVPDSAPQALPPATRVRPLALRVLNGLAALAAVAAAGALAAAVWDRLDIRSRIAGDDAPAVRARPIAYDGTLPLPRRGEAALARARALAAGGHLRDALAALDQIRPTDAEKADADRLRTEIQRELLNPGTARRSP